MKVGDVVVSMSESHPLRSGAEWYSHAIVGQVDPLILVSEHGDMVWSATVVEKLPHLRVTCQAHPDIVAVVLARLERDKVQRTVVETEKTEIKTEGSKVPRLLLLHRCTWTEYERGCGHRADGYTYAISKEALDREIKRQESLGDYDEYSRASDICRVFVTDELYDSLENAGGGVRNSFRPHEGEIGRFDHWRSND